MVIVSGGVRWPARPREGAFRDLGVEERFWGVRLRPGKPTWFGTRSDTLAFGLPGNPVSAMVTFSSSRAPRSPTFRARHDAARATAVLAPAVPRNPRRDETVRVG